jgi:hypothetical protein
MAWRVTAKWFCVSGFVAARGVTPCSGFVNTVIADSVIAALHAATPPVSNSGGKPTAGISRVPKAGRIIATGSRSTGVAGVGRA